MGFGYAPRFFIERLRSYVAHPMVLIYPEFFDDKNALLRSDRVSYVLRLLENRDRVVVALWPDYMAEDRFGLCSYDVLWVYPLHSLREVDRLPQCIEFLGFASERSLRDYTLAQFLDVAKQLGYRTWFLGASSRELRLALVCGFDGVDVTTLSIPGWRYSDSRRPDAPALVALFLENLAERRLLTRAQLYRLCRLCRDGG